MEHYGPDTETGESTIRTRTELCPAPTLSTCPVDDRAPDDAIPLAEIEDLERTPNEDPTEFRVLSVLSALRTLPPRYRIQWSDKTLSHEPATGLFGCAATVVEYWQSSLGVRHSRNWPRGSMASDKPFHYDDWKLRFLTPGAMTPSEISYILMVQLAGIRFTTHNAMVDGLKKNGFPADTRFNIWIVPRALHSEGAYAAVPILDVPFDILQARVVPSVWIKMIEPLTRHVSRIALGQEVVPVFYWHTATLDDKWGFPRGGSEAVDGIALADILRVARTV